jgi:hypothetical protein
MPDGFSRGLPANWTNHYRSDVNRRVGASPVCRADALGWVVGQWGATDAELPVYAAVPLAVVATAPQPQSMATNGRSGSFLIA